ncbi:hypothetical protein BKA69DRAFT_1086920 [Paraphysoderma sedebokerense]|nr:hypothetical protein BKA69DRAFT_1086920 [Paraphysoderma sedebokerense]
MIVSVMFTHSLVSFPCNLVPQNLHTSTISFSFYSYILAMSLTREDLEFIDLIANDTSTASTSDILLESSQSSPDDIRFDEIIGNLENLLLDPMFSEYQTQLFEKFAPEFEDCVKEGNEDGENKLIWMEYFKEYTFKMEKFIEQSLLQLIPDFNMSEFLVMLSIRKDQMNGDVFDLLSSLGDFSEFKGMMIDYVKDQSGSAVDFSDLIHVQSTSHKSSSISEPPQKSLHKASTPSNKMNIKAKAFVGFGSKGGFGAGIIGKKIG